MQRRQIGDRERADQEMRGDGRGDERQGPAMRLLHRIEEDGRPVETDAPAEHRDHKGRSDDGPAIEAVLERKPHADLLAFASHA